MARRPRKAAVALPAPAPARTEPLVTMADVPWILGTLGLGLGLGFAWRRWRMPTVVSAAYVESLPFVEDVIETSSSTSLSALRGEYQRLYASQQPRPERLATINAMADRVRANRARYEAAGAQYGVPWYVVGAIHQLEGGASFEKHMHNGDPLTARTVRHPPNRPAAGDPPFTWEESAADALARFRGWTDWSVAGTLWQLERYNGTGYRSRKIPTPYLWSFGNHYARGKFASDGPNGFDPNLVSRQVGAATLIHHLEAQGWIEPLSTG